MTQDIFASGTVEDLRTERAQRAVKAFRAMQPGLTGYAQAMTGKRSVRVELAEGVPRTDGTKIFFKPPIALGDLTPHSRGLCERRDRTTGQQLCAACKTREEVLITIYHEIAHIVFGTFQEVSESQKIKAMERAIEDAPSKYATQIKAAWDQIPAWKKNDYLNLSSLISPFLPTVVNVLEDARVDEGMFKARRGTRVMFDAYTKGIFAAGVEEDNGEFTTWATRPLNSQAIIGVFVLACGYDYKGWFHEDVEAALSDKHLRELVSRIDTLRSAEGSYNLAFPILARLRELGFCRKPEEEEEEPEAQPEPEEEPDDQESEEDSNEQDDDESGEGDGGQPDPEGSASSSGSDEDADPSEGAEPGDDEGSSEGGGPSDEGSDAPGEGTGGEGGSDEASDDEPQDDAGGPEAPDDVPADGAPEEGSDGDADGEAPSPGDADGPGSDGADKGDAPDVDGDEAGAPNTGGQDVEPGSEDGDGPGSPELLPGQPEPGSADQGQAPSEEGTDESPELPPGGLDDEVIDSGADEGEGGTETERPDYGTADQALHDVQVFSKHDGDHDQVPSTADERSDDKAIDRAIVQGQYFEKPSVNVEGVREHKYGSPVIEAGRNQSSGWEDIYGQNDDPYTQQQLRRMGIITDLEISESILGPSLLEMRRTFSDNERANMERHLRSGKINQRVLGKRAWAGDNRLFQKKRIPGKKSYAVLIGIDISGSTIGVNIALAKRAAMAQAELCARAGIDFAVYAHTANPVGNNWGRALWLDVYEIKAFNKPWDSTAKEALNKISSDSENLDGHTIEYYRKMIEHHPATDKVILYYSDGKMPAANHDEELEILKREITYCKAHKITLLGVGIRTDSPRRHGLDTVQVNDDSDIPQVVRHLQSALLHAR